MQYQQSDEISHLTRWHDGRVTNLLIIFARKLHVAFEFGVLVAESSILFVGGATERLHVCTADDDSEWTAGASPSAAASAVRDGPGPLPVRRSCTAMVFVSEHTPSAPVVTLTTMTDPLTALRDAVMHKREIREDGDVTILGARRFPSSCPTSYR